MIKPKKKLELSDLLPSAPTKPEIDPAMQRIFLIAPPKFGKSTWCNSFPDPIFLCTERGHDSIESSRIQIDRWDWLEDEAPDQISERMKKDKQGVRHMSFVDALSLLKGSDKFGTIIIDTLDKLYLMCTDYICAKKQIEHPSDEGYAKAWHAIRDEFIRAILTLHNINRGVIYISHVKYRDIENTRKGSKITQAEATIPNTCRAIIEPEVDIILHGGFEPDKESDKHQRVWRCEPSDSFRECGDRNGKLPKRFACDKVDGYARFSKFFTK